MAEKDELTAVRIWKNTKKKLDEIKKNESESYNDIIERLLEREKLIQYKLKFPKDMDEDTKKRIESTIDGYIDYALTGVFGVADLMIETQTQFHYSDNSKNKKTTKKERQ